MIDKITYSNEASGSFVGTMSYKVLFSPEGPMDIVDTMAKIRSHGLSKLVHLMGDFSKLDQDELFTMTKTLKDWGYVQMVTCNGKTYFPWFVHVNYIIVSTTEVWAGFDVHEFRWNNPEADPLLPSNADRNNLFISGRPEAVLAFIKKHAKDRPNPWRMLLVTRSYEEEVK